MKAGQDNRLTRVSSFELNLENDWGVLVSFFANEDINLEKKAVDELLKVISTQETVLRLQKEAPDFFDSTKENCLEKVVLTPDFHKGSGIPIGTVMSTKGFILPQAVGNDVNCGMRFETTPFQHEDIVEKLDLIEENLRNIFFGGGRNIPMTRTQRQALLQYGLPGLLDSSSEAKGMGIWSDLSLSKEERQLSKMHGNGVYKAKGIFGVEEYLKRSGGVTHDPVIGNVGGGNHFAEVQYVKKILNPQAAYEWGLKEGQVVMMIHSGSLGLGHGTGRYAMDILKRIYPKNSKFPENGIFPLPLHEAYSDELANYRCSLANSANFAFANRFMLSRMLLKGLACGKDAESDLIYDAPHNLMWDKDGRTVHRKGATPAGGWQEAQGTAYKFWGEPVIVPGSMGTSSYLMLGQGNESSLCSACHGAGRLIGRGAAMHVGDQEIEDFLNNFRIVTPINPKDASVKGRRDILGKWKAQLKQEAPMTYKNITPVVETLKEAQIAQPVAELYPILTVKS